MSESPASAKEPSGVPQLRQRLPLRPTSSDGLEHAYPKEGEDEEPRLDKKGKTYGRTPDGTGMLITAALLCHIPHDYWIS